MELYITKYNNQLCIHFKAFDKIQFYQMLNKIKSLTGRQYNPILKRWLVPDIDCNRKRLNEWGFDINYNKKEENKKINIKSILNSHLFEYQKKGVQFIHDKNGRVLLADEMGLGKTLQAIEYMKFKGTFPVLIICPAALKYNWEYEIKRWTNFSNIYIVNGQSDIIPPKDIIIINYDIIQSYIEQLKNIKLVIIDESHKIKNRKTKRYKAIKQICKNVKEIIALTGTPILNRPVEIFTTLNLIRPDIFPSFFRFANKYCAPKHNGFGIVYDGASNTKELHELLIKEVMLRRLKKDVLKQLPDKLISIIPIEIDNKEEYNLAKNDFTEWYLEKEKKVIKVEALTRIEKLKQLAVKGKLNAIMNWIKNVLENNNKLVIMCTHHFTIDFLIKKFEAIAVKLDGRDNEKEKNSAVQKFQNNKNIKLFIGNIKAAGIGLTLTASSILAFIELGWSPAEHNQAADRIHRIGQKNSCNIYYLIAKDTIEQNIISLIDKKRKIIDSIHDGIKTKQENLLNELLINLKEN